MGANLYQKYIDNTNGIATKKDYSNGILGVEKNGTTNRERNGVNKEVDKEENGNEEITMLQENGVKKNGISHETKLPHCRTMPQGKSGQITSLNLVIIVSLSCMVNT